MKGFTKYIVVFVITVAIFGTAWYVSSYLNARKFARLQEEQNKISIDILSSETQFELLNDDTCSAESVFSHDLASLAEKISYSEKSVATTEEISTLKKQYTLLEVRDFLLTNRVAERCKQPSMTILYFYGTSEKCPDCVKQGYVLDAFREAHREARIYAFDYNLDLSTIKALRDIYKVSGDLPALVINETTYSGFQSFEQLEAAAKK